MTAGDIADVSEGIPSRSTGPGVCPPTTKRALRLDSAAAAYFNAVWRNLLELTFDELPASVEVNGNARWFEVVGRLLEGLTELFV